MDSILPFIPTPYEDIEAFFELAPVSSSDVVYDLGSGDGRLLFTALEKGVCRAVGVEWEPRRVYEARETARKRSLEGKVIFVEADVMDVNLSEATVVLCYLLPVISAPLKLKFQSELKPGTRLVMESFPIWGWKPAQVKVHGHKPFFLYLMPPEIGDYEYY